MQVIDFMLQDAGVPSRSFNEARRTCFVQALHTHLTRARHNCGEAGHAEASLEELYIGRGLLVHHRVNDRMEGNWPALALSDLLGGQPGKVLLLVFDDGEL